VARVICDIANPDGTPFAGCPRSTLKRAIDLAAAKGFAMRAGPEAEFFLFQRRQDGQPTTETHDSGGYFDLTPVDLGEDVRREIVRSLEQMVARGPRTTGRRASTRSTPPRGRPSHRRQREHLPVRRKRREPQRPARTLCPADLRHQRSAHTHQSLSRGRNVFCDEKRGTPVERVASHYVGGLKHAKAFCAVTNPLVNLRGFVPG
jgi:glutamine synthetase